MNVNCMVALVAATTLSFGAFAADTKARKPASEQKAPAPKAPAPVAAPAKKEPRKALHDEVTGQGYGIAGCGLGSIVFGAKPGKIQIIAATLNGTAGTQTFGITSGTSNCELPQMGHQAAVFIEVNREVVMKDAARGKGETLAGLSEIFGCKDEALLSESVQKNYEQIFRSENAYENSRQILNTIESNEALKASCNTLG